MYSGINIYIPISLPTPSGRALRNGSDARRSCVCVLQHGPEARGGECAKRRDFALGILL